MQRRMAWRNWRRSSMIICCSKSVRSRKIRRSPRRSLTSAAKADSEGTPAIAAVNRCATQNQKCSIKNQVQRRLFPQPVRIRARRGSMNISIRISIRTTLAVVLITSSMSAQDRSSARSMVVTRYGIVATSHVQASVAGSQILARGGSAVDAAIAANAVLGVTEPMMNGMGGDLFAIYWDAKTGKLYGLNASGWATRGLTIEHLRAKGATSMPVAGVDSVTVPGAVDGWAKAHARFGRLPWKDLFAPAIYYAEHGYPVPEVIHDYWQADAQTLKQTPEAGRLFLP